MAQQHHAPLKLRNEALATVSLIETQLKQNDLNCLKRLDRPYKSAYGFEGADLTEVNGNFLALHLVQMPDHFRAFWRQRDEKRGMSVHVPARQYC